MGCTAVRTPFWVVTCIVFLAVSVGKDIVVGNGADVRSTDGIRAPPTKLTYAEIVKRTQSKPQE